MKNTARTLEAQLQAKVVGQVELSAATDTPQSANHSPLSPADSRNDVLLSGGLGIDLAPSTLLHEVERLVTEINELQSANRWSDIIDLCHPLEDKWADLVDAGMDDGLRLKLSFALCQNDQHEEAISCLVPLVKREPENSLAHYNIGYIVLDCFFRSRSNRKLVPVRRRAELLELGHLHFEKAIEIRPDSVTFCYRYAILLKEIERKSRKAIPYFRKAIKNWQEMSSELQKRYHQMYPKYIKAMYHLASCELEEGHADTSLGLLEKVLTQDFNRNHLHPLFKHYAMGKVLHELGRLDECLQHLETALQRSERGQPTDFVYELVARTHQRLNQPQKGMQAIGKIPVRARRPYVRWTEATLLNSLGRQEEAMALLRKVADRDRRARHVALIRLCRIALGVNQLQRALKSAEEAVRFCQETYTNPSKEAMFWQAVCHFRLNQLHEAHELIKALEESRFRYPHFGRLALMVRESLRKTNQHSGRENER